MYLSTRVLRVRNKHVKNGTRYGASAQGVGIDQKQEAVASFLFRRRGGKETRRGGDLAVLHSTNLHDDEVHPWTRIV